MCLPLSITFYRLFEERSSWSESRFLTRLRLVQAAPVAKDGDRAQLEPVKPDPQ